MCDTARTEWKQSGVDEGRGSPAIGATGDSVSGSVSVGGCWFRISADPSCGTETPPVGAVGIASRRIVGKTAGDGAGSPGEARAGVALGAPPGEARAGAALGAPAESGVAGGRPSERGVSDCFSAGRADLRFDGKSLTMLMARTVGNSRFESKRI